jgi:hypothetical protein
MELSKDKIDLLRSPQEESITSLSKEYNDRMMLHHNFSSNDEAYYDDLLQRVLSVLSELPDLSIHGIRELRALKVGDNGYRPSDDLALATNVLSEMAAVLGHPEKPFPSTEFFFFFSRNIWETGLILVSNISNHIPPTVLHATAMTSYYFSDASKSVNGRGCNIFPMLCILLCCRALQNLISSQECPSWKRSQSLLFDTVRLHDEFQKCHDPELPFTVALWFRLVFPVTAAWHHLLWQRYHIHPAPMWRWYMAYEAVAVARISHLIVLLQRSQNLLPENDTFRSSVPFIAASLDQHLLFGQYDWLCDHAWRSYTICRHPKDNIVSAYQESIRSDVGPTASQALTYFTIDFDSDELNEERRDLLCGLSSTWSDLGIALLVSLLWNSRPKVWAIAYEWRLFFPQVKSLLLAEQEDEEMDPLESMRRCAPVVPHGYRLLEELLSQTRTHSLSIAKDESAPNSPLRTCQLLLNHMMEASNSKSQQMQPFPNAVHIYQELKLLLAKYRPIDQVEIVDRLIRNCPYPGLKPKIVDLLRSMVEWKYANEAESKIWHFVERNFLLTIDEQLRRYSTGTSSTSTIVSIFVNDAELYTAYLGLIHIWIMCRRKIPDDLNNVQNRIVEIHSTLQRLLAQHAPSNNSQSPSLEPYRLGLLENSLQRTIDVMSELDSFEALL